MIENYSADNNPELLGIAPAIAALIGAGVSAGTTVAALVAAKRQQSRATSSQTSAQQHQQKLAEIALKAKQAAQENYLKIGAIAAIPIGIIAIKKFTQKKGRKK